MMISAILAWDSSYLLNAILLRLLLHLGCSNKENTCVKGNLTLLKFTGEPRIFFSVSGKNIIIFILKGISPFKMHKIKLFKKKMCVYPTKIFRPVTLNTFIWPNKVTALRVYHCYIYVKVTSCKIAP